MTYVGLDENMYKEATSLVSLGFDVIAARPGEMDYDFVARVLEHNCVAILSKDTDIYQILDRFNDNTPIYASLKAFKRSLKPEHHKIALKHAKKFLRK